MQTILYFAEMKICLFQLSNSAEFILLQDSLESQQGPYLAKEKDEMESHSRLKKAQKNPILLDRVGGDKWTRTTDSRIFSPMLYQLSYITVL